MNDDQVRRVTVPRKRGIACIPPHRDRVRAEVATREDYPQPGLWQQFSYDRRGDLIYGDKRVLDWVERYDAPLSVIDATWVRRRVTELRALLDSARRRTGFTGATEIYYAAKARMHAAVVVPAYQAGALGETSSAQDLLHLELLYKAGLLPRGFAVISNGFKLPPERLDDRLPTRSARFEDSAGLDRYIEDYASAILRSHAIGLDVVPILDSLDEVDWFSRRAAAPMRCGLRLAFGVTANRGQLDIVNAGFGMTVRQVRTALRRLKTQTLLRPTMLHAMVGAAEASPTLDEIVEGARLSAEIFFELAKDTDSLDTLNLGGGLPLIGDGYDHGTAFSGIMRAIMAEANRFGARRLPRLAFEPGSLIAAEANFNVLPVLAVKAQGSVGGAPILFGVVDGSFIESSIDGLLLGHDFPVLPANLANRRAYPMWLRGVTCDSMDVWPPSTVQRDWLRLPVPRPTEKLFVVVAHIGAYQESLTGKGGVNHCAVKEPAEIVVDGDRHVLIPSAGVRDSAKLMGYTRKLLNLLAPQSRAARAEPAPAYQAGSQDMW
ncbi:MAG: hypothetical protein K1X39_14290 [Thermoflexales bacterium]|nr:hypothetical protein [Thermoflexales bacterium]